jgi:hypothetical protein
MHENDAFLKRSLGLKLGRSEDDRDLVAAIAKRRVTAPKASKLP